MWLDKDFEIFLTSERNLCLLVGYEPSAANMFRIALFAESSFQRSFLFSGYWPKSSVKIAGVVLLIPKTSLSAMLFFRQWGRVMDNCHSASSSDSFLHLHDNMNLPLCAALPIGTT